MSSSEKRSVRFTEAPSSSSDPPPPKRSRLMGSNETSMSTSRSMSTPKPTGVLRPSSHGGPIRGNNSNKNNNNRQRQRQRQRQPNRGNEDELDDIDDWNEWEDGDDPSGNAGLPSRSQLIAAKRQRRERKGEVSARFEEDDHNYDEHNDHNDGNDDDDNDDDETMKIDASERSLAAEGVRIEPFHMREEETDGTGYFDGDTYVFRRNVPAGDGEADAWADTLMEDQQEDGGDSNSNSNNIRNTASGEGRTSSIDAGIATNIRPKGIARAFYDGVSLSTEELFRRIVIHLGDPREPIMQAIQRYGKLAEPKKKSRRKKSKKQQQQQQAEANGGGGGDDRAILVAKSHLDDLAGAANVLLLKGDVDIYGMTKLDIFRKFPALSNEMSVGASTATTTTAGTSTGAATLSTTTTAATTTNTAQKTSWEYHGDKDHKLHMVTTEQMIGWVRSGYFVGAQRVKIRTVTTVPPESESQAAAEAPTPAPTPAPSLATKDDMLADLMDDDDDEEVEVVEEEEQSRPTKKARESGAATIVKGEWMWSDEVDYQKYL